MNLYTHGQISKAANALSRGLGTLPERVRDAWSFLCVCKDLTGFEKEFEAIRERLSSVHLGDWSGVTGDDYEMIASIIREMDLSSMRLITIREDVRILASTGAGIGIQGNCETN